MLQITNFKKEYQNHLVLAIPELLIPKGVSWFQGVNGSGKSTFFKAISGIIPFEGQVVSEDKHDLIKQPIAFRKIINYSFAEPRYPDFLSGKDIIDYYIKVHGGNRADAEEMIALFELKEYYKKAISSYSSGMLKKIALTTAFIGNPKIIALDEPLTTIDKGSQEKLLGLLAEKVNQGINLLIASHHNLPESNLKVNHHFLVENQTITKLPNI